MADRNNELENLKKKLKEMCDYEELLMLYELYCVNDEVDIGTQDTLKQLAKIAFENENYILFERLVRRVSLNVFEMEQLIKLDCLSAQFKNDLYLEILLHDHVEYMYPYAKWYCGLQESVDTNIHNVIFCLEETYDINNLEDIADLVYLYRKTHNDIAIKTLYEKALSKSNKSIQNYLYEKLK